MACRQTEPELTDRYLERGAVDTRQAVVSRHFLDPALERLFISHTFPSNRTNMRFAVVALFVYHTIRRASKWCVWNTDLGLWYTPEAEWHSRVVSLSVLFFPIFSCLGMLTFTHSHHCKPSTLGPVFVFFAFCLAIGGLLPRALMANHLVADNGVPFGNMTGSAFALLAKDPVSTLQLFQTQTISYVVLQFVAAFGCSLIGDAAGLSPPMNIAVCAIWIAMYVILSHPPFRAKYGELAVTTNWWHPTLTVIFCGAAQTYTISLRKRSSFLVHLLTANHKAIKIEQLSREKECLEWQRRFAQITSFRLANMQQPSAGDPLDHHISLGISPPSTLSFPPGPPSKTDSVATDGSMPSVAHELLSTDPGVSFPHLLGELFGEDVEAVLHDYYDRSPNTSSHMAEIHSIATTPREKKTELTTAAREGSSALASSLGSMSGTTSPPSDSEAARAANLEVAAAVAVSAPAKKRARVLEQSKRRTASHRVRVNSTALKLTKEPALLLNLTWLQLERLNSSRLLRLRTVNGHTSKVSHFLSTKMAGGKRARRAKADVVADIVDAWPEGTETIVLEPKPTELKATEVMAPAVDERRGGLACSV